MLRQKMRSSHSEFTHTPLRLLPLCCSSWSFKIAVPIMFLSLLFPRSFIFSPPSSLFLLFLSIVFLCLLALLFLSLSSVLSLSLDPLSLFFALSLFSLCVCYSSLSVLSTDRYGWEAIQRASSRFLESCAWSWCQWLWTLLVNTVFLQQCFLRKAQDGRIDWID